MLFSFFQAPITNTTSCGEISLRDTYYYIISDKAKSGTTSLRAAPSAEEHDTIKRQCFDFVTFAGIFAKRAKEGLVRPSGLVCLDFDHVSLPNQLEAIKQQIAQDDMFPTMLAFTSPSGDGLKVIVRINYTPDEYATAYASLCSFFKRNYGIEADPQCKDIARACFLPYDPTAILRESDTVSPFDIHPFATPVSSPMQLERSTQDYVENVIRQLETNRTDITASYEHWVKIGFALADEFGESGRHYFHRISQFYPQYSRDEADKQFDNCLRAHSGAVRIGTFFHYCQEVGINCSTPQTKKQACGSCGTCGSLSTVTKNNGAEAAEVAEVRQSGNTSTFENDLNKAKLPTIYDTVKEKLPSILARCTENSRSTIESDVRFLSSLAVISATMPNVFGIYGGQKVYSNLYLIIDGPASSKKGKGTPANLIGQPIHDNLVNEYNLKMAEYSQAMEAFIKETKKGVKGIKEPQKPIRKTFYMPANSTDSAIINQIANNGGNGMIMETELDTVNSAFKSKHGNYSALLRKGFHHEPLSLLRRTADEFIEIPCPRIGLCISGTPGQINTLIGSAENGLFSRMAFYCTALDSGWDSPWTPEGEKITQDLFREIGKDYYLMYRTPLLEEGDISFSLSKEQQDEFDRSFGTMKKDFLEEEGASFAPSVHRMGLTCFRISLILSTLRVLESGNDIPSTITCDDNSFQAALDISLRLLEHSRFVYTHLPSSALGVNPRAKEFYNALPESFDRKRYLQVADKLGLKPKTVERYVTRLVAAQWLSNNYNCYKKTLTRL